MRFVRKAAKAPENRRLVSHVRPRFHLRISLQESNRDRKRQELSENKESWLSEFLGRPDHTPLIPGKNDQVYMGKIDGQKICNIAN